MSGSEGQAHSAALSLTVAAATGGRLLTLSSVGRVIGSWSLDKAELEDARTTLRAALVAVHDAAGNNLTLKQEESEAAVHGLVKIGRRLLFSLAPEQEQQAQFERATHPLAQQALRPDLPSRVVEVVYDRDFLFPFELLRWIYVNPTADTATLSRSLMGMSAVVQRRVAGVENRPDPSQLANHPRLPLSVFHHPKLSASRLELEYFAMTAALTDVYGPWPEKGPAAKVRKSDILRHILDHRAGVLPGEAPDLPSEILHFACHTVTKDRPSDRHAIKLAADFEILLGDLKEAVVDPPYCQVPPPRPLVFLNSCGSAPTSVGEGVSFPQFFLHRAYRGVIGTLCDISDEVAHFSQHFYKNLLEGRTVGESMHRARWHLMDVHRNPLGLLYTFHGNPDLRVARSRRGQVPRPPCTAVPT